MVETNNWHVFPVNDLKEHSDFLTHSQKIFIGLMIIFLIAFSTWFYYWQLNVVSCEYFRYMLKVPARCIKYFNNESCPYPKTKKEVRIET